jgi:peptidyl-prolyl cis-trans isomerase D
VSDGLDWVFKEAAPGDVSPVFEDQQAFYMMELVEATPEGIQPLDSARPLIEQYLRLEKKMALALEEAEELVVVAREAGSLDALEGRDGLTVETAGPLARNAFFPGLGYQSASVGAAFGLDIDEISDPVDSNNNVFLIQAVERIPADSTAWEEQKETQRAQAVFSVQQQRLEQWIVAMREAADINDQREAVFQASQQQSQNASTGGLF